MAHKLWGEYEHGNTVLGRSKNMGVGSGRDCGKDDPDTNTEGT